MADDDARPSSAGAKAVLLSPDGLTVLWDSESALGATKVNDATPSAGASLSEVIPMAEMMGVAAAATEVAATGVPKRLSTDVVTTSKGSMTFSCGVFRLPSGQVLVLAENSWRASNDRRAERRGVAR